MSPAPVGLLSVSLLCAPLVVGGGVEVVGGIGILQLFSLVQHVVMQEVMVRFFAVAPDMAAVHTVVFCTIQVFGDF